MSAIGSAATTPRSSAESSDASPVTGRQSTAAGDAVRADRRDGGDAPAGRAESTRVPKLRLGGDVVGRREAEQPRSPNRALVDGLVNILP